MITFNLTHGFEPFGVGTELTSITFPSQCEVHVRLPVAAFHKESFDGTVLVTARISSSDDIMRIMFIADALDRIQEVKQKFLFIPFVPYARQDHIVAPGEALSLKVFSRMINSCGFDQVTVFDPHSDVTAALLDRVQVHSNLALVKKVLDGKSDYWLASPDAGAYKKVGKIADQLGYDKQIVACGKVRDPNPENKGKILGMSVPNIDLQGKDVYILDDICEGGMTFMTLARELRKQNVGRVYLIVSHAVMSKGDEEMKKYLDGVWTTDSFATLGQTDPDFVKEVKLCTIL
jgi:ribose-phosphate pyrophosphokinase